MSETSWEDVVDLPDELDDGTAEERFDQAAEVQDGTGELSFTRPTVARKAST